MKAKISFFLFHLVMIGIQIALAVLGLVFLEQVFYLFGAAIILFGLCTTFVGPMFVSGFYERGGEIVYFSVREKFIGIISTVILGLVVMFLPELVDVPESLVAIGIFAAACVIGYRFANENYYYENYLRPITSIMGKIIPVLYIFASGIFVLVGLLSWSLTVLIAFTAFVCALHVLRLVLMCIDDPF